MKNGLTSVAGCGSDFLHAHRDPDGGWLPDLNQRVRDVNVGGEDSGPQRTRGVNRIGGGGINAFDMMPRTENRDACRIGIDFNDLLPTGEITCHPRMNLDFPGQMSVERQVQLAGYDLLDHDLVRRLALAESIRCLTSFENAGLSLSPQPARPVKTSARPTMRTVILVTGRSAIPR